MACRNAFSSVSGSLSIAMQFPGGVSKAKERMYRIGISRRFRVMAEIRAFCLSPGVVWQMSVTSMGLSIRVCYYAKIRVTEPTVQNYSEGHPRLLLHLNTDAAKRQGSGGISQSAAGASTEESPGKGRV
jgi:hypothetical protein